MSFFKKLGLKYPLIVAPMAGGPSSASLVIAASKSGALGSIGAAYLNSVDLRTIVGSVREKTQNPLAVNLFLPTNLPKIQDERLDNAIIKTQMFRDELNLPRPRVDYPYEEDFSAQFEAVLSLRPTVFSFVFGALSESYTREAHKLGIFLIGTATTPQEAYELEESGVNAIVTQGVEAGGHRGIFNPLLEDPNVSTLELVTKVRANVKVPIIAAGGIMSQKDVRAAMIAGADAIQMGTAFLATHEAGTSQPYRRTLLESDSRATELTRAFSGRWARGISNRFTKEMRGEVDSILPFPAQNKLTRDLRNACTALGSSDFLSLWCGAGKGELWTGTTQDLIHKLFEDFPT